MKSAHMIRIGQRFFINYVECKCSIEYACILEIKCLFFINYVECKCISCSNTSVIPLSSLLTMWNVNLTVIADPRVFLEFFINYVECKFNLLPNACDFVFQFFINYVECKCHFSCSTQPRSD